MIYKDRQQCLWFGTFGGGVCCFDGSSFTTYTTADGLLDNRVYDMLQDREENFWFIHGHSGLTRFDPETARLLTEATVSETLIQTSEGVLWFNNANQLCCLYNEEQRCQTFDSGVSSPMEDSSRRFWVGTFGDGLYCYDSTHAVWEGKPKHFTTEDGLDSNTICSVIEARDGTIWVGTAGSPGCLCRFDGSRFETIQTPHPVVFRLLEDSRGRIWMGGWRGGGLSYYDPGESRAAPLHNYTTKHGLPSDNVLSIVEDDAGRLWIGSGADLCCFDENQFTSYSEETPDLMNQFSAKDVNGQLWFGTLGNGVYRYDGKHFQQLSKADGLSSNSVTGFVPQPDGSMIIGTLSGIVHYRPTATVPPRIEIREVVADQVYPHPSALELTATGADLVTIAYHGLSLSTHRMRYSYTLEGYDQALEKLEQNEEREGWRDTWESQVRYEKLPPGEYTFRVIAINRDLVCSEAPATLQLTVVPDPRDEQIAKLESELERRNRELEAELQDAREMQLSLLPESAPPIEDFDIAGACEPAMAVGGDYFTYLWLDGDKTQLGIVLMDVTGHGMKAATTTFLANGMLRSESRSGRTPAEIMTRMHESLQEVLPQTAFVSMSFAVIDLRDKVLTHFNAGQPAPILIRES
jgi:streptogramin lyase